MMQQLQEGSSGGDNVELDDLDQYEGSKISVERQRLKHNLRFSRWNCIRDSAQLVDQGVKLLRHFVMLLGCYRLAVFISSILLAACPDETASLLSSVVFRGKFSRDVLSNPDAVQPIMCHSHNDYWRAQPFRTAVEAGCISIEADVYYNEGNLFVGHTTEALQLERTLETLYLNPLLDRLNHHNTGSLNRKTSSAQRNGIFLSDPHQSLVLVIDMKKDSDLIWPVLNKQLEPLRSLNYLAHFDGIDMVSGPVIVVTSGDASFYDIVRNSSYRDVFFDAPLDLIATAARSADNVEDISEYLVDKAPVATDSDIDYRTGLPVKYPLNAAVYSISNSYYASTSFKHSVGYAWNSQLSTEQISLIRRHIRAAHSKGLRVRYFGVPSWPLSMRNYLWRVLIREGVDVLSVDDIKAVTQLDFGPRKGGWNRKWWE